MTDIKQQLAELERKMAETEKIPENLYNPFLSASFKLRHALLVVAEQLEELNKNIRQVK